MKNWIGEAFYLLSAIIVLLMYNNIALGFSFGFALWMLFPVILWATVYLLSQKKFKGVHLAPIVAASLITMAMHIYYLIAFVLDLGGIATGSSTSAIALFYTPLFSTFAGLLAFIALKTILYIKVKRNEV